VRIVLTAVIFGLFGAMFVPFFTPLLMAALFGFALEGVVSKYAPRRSARRVPTALILLFFFLLIAIPLGVVGYHLVSIVRDLAQMRIEDTAVYHSVEQLLASFSELSDRLFFALDMNPPEGGLTELLPKAGAWVLAYTAAIASRTPELVIHLFVFCAALYVFLTESRYIRATVSSFGVLKESELDEIIRVVQRSSYRTLVVSAALGSVQALVVAVGGLIFGFKEFFLIFMITFFTSFIPVIGAGPIAVLLAILSFIQGNVFSGVGLIIVAAVAGSVDNFIKPLVVASGGEESLNPVISLLAIIGAVLVYGIPGLLLGPILTELTLKIVPILFSEEEKESGETVVEAAES
jgi:predicted PurR-regulated permease PerM